MQTSTSFKYIRRHQDSCLACHNVCWHNLTCKSWYAGLPFQPMKKCTCNRMTCLSIPIIKTIGARCPPPIVLVWGDFKAWFLTIFANHVDSPSSTLGNLHTYWMGAHITHIHGFWTGAGCWLRQSNGGNPINPQPQYNKQTQITDTSTFLNSSTMANSKTFKNLPINLIPKMDNGLIMLELYVRCNHLMGPHVNIIP